MRAGGLGCVMSQSIDLESVLRKLDRYDGLHIEQTTSSFVILAPTEDGFDIRLVAREGSIVVLFDTWQRRVDDLDVAWNLISLGLSDGGRLRLEPTLEGRALCWFEYVLPDGSWQALREPDRDPNRFNAGVYHRQNHYTRAFYRAQAGFKRASAEGPEPMYG